MKAENGRALKEHLVQVLNSSEAHANFDSAVKDLAANVRGKRPNGAAHSPWEVLEHMRIAQWDILEFTRNAKHVSPEFPGGYWPKTQGPPDEKAWSKSIEAFRSDLKAMTKLVEDESTNLLAPIAHGDGKTILREALLLADHNAYHLAELVLLRRLLGAWE